MTDRKHTEAFFCRLRRGIRKRRAFLVFLILFAAILAVGARSIAVGAWENVFTCVLALFLMFLPSLVERGAHVELPTALQILAYLFVFCAAILGEIGNYYQRFPFWDTMLHAANGFLFAAFGFCLADLFNNSTRTHFRLSPLFLTVVAFCFSMTIGVLWEFFEFAADRVLHTDMQKDVILHEIHTVSLPNDVGSKVTHLRGIMETVLVSSDGGARTVAGALDVGLYDTMKDLFVNFIGALVFGVIGFFYEKYPRRGHLARQFIPIFRGEERKKRLTEKEK